MPEHKPTTFGLVRWIRKGNGLEPLAFDGIQASPASTSPDRLRDENEWVCPQGEVKEFHRTKQSPREARDSSKPHFLDA